MFFANLKVGTKLATGFGIMVLLLIGTTFIGITRLSALNQSTELIVKDRYPKVALANQAMDGINRNAIMMRNLLIMTDPDRIKSEVTAIAANSADVTEYVGQLDKLLSTPKGREIFNALQEARAKYETGQAAFTSLVENGKKDEATTLLLTGLILDQQAYFGQVKGLVKLGGQLMDKSGAEVTEQYRSGVDIMLALAAAPLCWHAASPTP